MRIILAATAVAELAAAAVLAVQGGHNTEAGAWTLAAASTAGWFLAEAAAERWRLLAARRAVELASCRPEDRP